MKKLMLTVILCLIAATGSVFAHDCNLVASGDFENVSSTYKDIYKKYEKIISTSGFNQAFTNLKAYCCTKGDLLTCTEKEKNNLPKLYPKSAWLFDQLLDVSMRRLDGISKLAYGLQPDPAGLERRKKMDEIACSTSGIPAKEIEKLYTGYRTQHTESIKNIDSIINNYNGSNLATFSLSDKYSALCSIINNIYIEIYKDIPTENRGTVSSFYDSCKNLTKERVNREYSYVKVLMVQKSNQLLDETTKAYTKKNFVEEKLMALRNIIAGVKDMFQTIVKQAPVSKTCSK